MDSFLKKTILTTLLTCFASVALAGSALKHDNILEARLAGERIILSPHMGPSFVQLSTNPLAVVLGDSRTAGAMGVNNTSVGTFSSSVDMGKSYPGWLFPQSGNRLIAPFDYNYGIGSSTSASAAGRVDLAGSACNAAGNTTAPCFNATKATAASTLANASSISITWISGDIPAVGDYLQIIGIANYACRITGVSGTGPGYTLSIPYTPNDPVACLHANVPASTTVSVVHPAKASNFAKWDAANSKYYFWGPIPVAALATTLNNVDITQNSISLNLYSPQSHPSDKVFLLTGVNDDLMVLNASQYTSVSNIIYMFNALSNKYVIIADELPRGQTTGITADGSPEIQTVTGGTITVSNAGTFIKDNKVYYAPVAASGPPFAPGANDGKVLINCTPCTPPSAGYYNVSVAGVYTFHSNDNGAKLALWYTWGAGGPSDTTKFVHEWLASKNCGSFTSTLLASNFTIPTSGAQCPGAYPWVHVAPTWDTLIDKTQPCCVNKPYTLTDGLHPSTYGGSIIAKTMLDTATAAGLIPPTPTFLPASGPNNFTFNGSVPTAGTIGTNSCSVPTLDRRNFIQNVALMDGTTLAAMEATLAGSASAMFLGTTVFNSGSGNGYFNVGTTVICVDTVHNYLQLSSQALLNGNFLSQTVYMVALADPSNLIVNGMFHNGPRYNYTSAALPICGGVGNPYCGTPTHSTNSPTDPSVSKGLPFGWSNISDTGSLADLGAGTMGMAYGIETNPLGDGYDDLVLQFQGYTTQRAIPLFKYLFPAPEALSVYLSTQYRAMCEVLISAGPNGRLAGLDGVSISAGLAQPTFTPPNTPFGNSYTVWAGEIGNSTVSLTDANLATGAPNVQQITVNGVSVNAMVMNYVTPPFSAISAPNNVSYLSISPASQAANDVFSATVRVRRCRTMVVTQ